MHIPSSLLKTATNKFERFGAEKDKINHNDANESYEALPKNIDKVSFSDEVIENYTVRRHRRKKWLSLKSSKKQLFLRRRRRNRKHPALDSIKKTPASPPQAEKQKTARP